jgi:FKBP-type peptidyl-prolyl cis-trans isomerase 2
MKTAPLIAIILSLFVLTACFGPVVERGDDATITYTGRYANGTIFDTNDPAHKAEFNGTHFTPLSVRLGAHQLIPGFENALLGMRKGESKSVTVKALDAYGAYDGTKILSVPKYLEIPLEATIQRNITIPNDKAPAELKNLGMLGKNFSTQSMVYKVVKATNLGIELYALAPVNDTITLEGYTWNSTLIKATPDAFTFLHDIGLGRVYMTPYGPYNATERNLTHVTMRTTVQVGKVYQSASGVGRATKESENAITIDFNHPLAGYDLTFGIKVDDIVKKK